MKKKIRLFSPAFDDREIKAAVKALKSSTWASGAGSRSVIEFEEKFKKYTSSSACITVNSGTAALHLALGLFDIRGKEVLVPSLTFVTTIHSILYNGGIPVFVDVDSDALCIDVDDLKEKITKKTKVILPVHFGGHPCNINKIRDVAKQNSLKTVYDAAHACGAKYHNEIIGSQEDAVCFSFHPVKNLAMPKGGAITINTNNSIQIKEKLNALRWCGITNRKNSFYDVSYLGFNHYMDEISAAIGIEQLKKISKLNKRRLEIAKRYDSELNIDRKIPLNKNCSYHLYWIRIKNRNRFLDYMQARGIEVGTHYSPAHLMSFYSSKSKLAVTEEVGNEIVTLPMHPNLTDDDLDRILKTVNSFGNN